MKAIIDEVALFFKGIEGPKCPQCRKDSKLISTTNEFKFYCEPCNIRFNDEDVIYALST